MFKLGAFTRPKEKPRRYARGRLTAFEAERPGRLQVDDELEFLNPKKEPRRSGARRGHRLTLPQQGRQDFIAVSVA